MTDKTVKYIQEYNHSNVLLILSTIHENVKRKLKKLIN